MLLGRDTPVVDTYAPDVLYPLPRAPGRAELGLTGDLPFSGVDLWHAYEMSWLDAGGRPLARVGRFSMPASAPNMVESKSFNLYLNSLNNQRFASESALIATVTSDLERVVGQGVALELLAADDPALAGAALDGTCLDALPVAVPDGGPAAAMLRASSARRREEKLYSHLLRSLCPVTGQPDWATVWLHYRGAALEHETLLRYLLAYRRHQGFHEQCVERMFCDIRHSCQPEFLHIQAFYTRRGGLDINPWRSTDPAGTALPRLNRQ